MALKLHTYQSHLYGQCCMKTNPINKKLVIYNESKGSWLVLCSVTQTTLYCLFHVIISYTSF